MSLGFGQRFGRVLCFLAVFGPLALATTGCDGDGAKKTDGTAVAVPPTVEESNKNMENMMKPKKAK